jgi:hypothetical protein
MTANTEWGTTWLKRLVLYGTGTLPSLEAKDVVCASLTVNGSPVTGSDGSDGPTPSSVTSLPNTLVLRDALGNFGAGTITGTLNGTAFSASSFTGSLSGMVTGTQSATTIANLPDSALDTISTAGKVADSATSATTSATASTIAKKDGSVALYANTFIGDTDSTSMATHNVGHSTSTLNLGVSNAAGTVNIGTGNSAKQVNIGDAGASVYFASDIHATGTTYATHVVGILIALPLAHSMLVLPMHKQSI